MRFLGLTTGHLPALAILFVLVLLSSNVAGVELSGPVPHTAKSLPDNEAVTKHVPPTPRPTSECPVPKGWLPLCPGPQGTVVPLGASGTPWTMVSNGTGMGDDSSNGGMVYDAADNYTMLVGWEGTWTFNGATWTYLNISTPFIPNGGNTGPAIYPSLAFDPDPSNCFVGTHGCVVMLLGYNGTNSEFEFQYAGGVWKNVTSETMITSLYSTSLMPPIRGTSLVWDSNYSTCDVHPIGIYNMTGCLLAIGGFAANTSCPSPCDNGSTNRTWEYLPTDGWSELTNDINLWLANNYGPMQFVGPMQATFDPILHEVLMRDPNVGYEQIQSPARGNRTPANWVAQGAHYYVLAPQPYAPYIPEWQPIVPGCPADVGFCTSTLNATYSVPWVFNAANDFLMNFGGAFGTYGGYNHPYWTNGTYAFVGDTTSPVSHSWVNLTALAGLGSGTKPEPSERSGAMMVYDPKPSDCGNPVPAHGCVLLYGGLTNPYQVLYGSFEVWRFWLPVTPEVYAAPNNVASGSALWLNVTVLGGTGHYTYYNRSWVNNDNPTGCGPGPTQYFSGTRANQAWCVPVLSASCGSNPWSNFFNITVTVTDTANETGVSGPTPVEVEPSPLTIHFYRQYAVMYPGLSAMSALGPGFAPNQGNDFGIVAWANAYSYSSPSAWFPNSVQADIVGLGGLTVQTSLVAPSNQLVWVVNVPQSYILKMGSFEQIEFQVEFQCAVVHTVLDLNATSGAVKEPYFPVGNSNEFGLVEPDQFLSTLWNYVIPTLNYTHLVTLTSTVSQPNAGSGYAPFNWSWTLSATIKLDFAKELGASLPSPLSGAANLVSPVSISLSISSGGAVGLTGAYAFPSFKIAGLPFNISVSASAQGKWQIVQTLQGSSFVSNLVLTNLSVGVTVSTTVSASIPISPFGFSIPGVGSIGLTITFTFTLSVGVSLWLSEKQGGTLFLGILPAQVANLETLIKVIIGVAVGISILGFGVSLGGTLEFDIYLESTGPFLRGMLIAGTVYVSVSAWFFSASVNLIQGTFWQEGNPTPGSVHHPENGTTSNGSFVIGPRFYNGTGYQQLLWTPGAFNGTLMGDTFPEGSYSLASGSNGSYLAYATDNVSRARSQGLSIGLLHVDPTGRTVQPVAMPATPGEDTIQPTLATLPDGSLLAMWQALPGSETSVTSPYAIRNTLLQYSELNAGTGSWSPVQTIASWGFPSSAVYSACGTDPRVAFFDTPTIFAHTGNLVEYDLATGMELYNASVTAPSQITSFDCSSGLLSWQDMLLGHHVTNLSSGTSWNIPSLPGYNVSQVFGVAGAPGVIGVLYRNQTNSQVQLLRSSGGTPLAYWYGGNNISGVEAAADGGGFVLAAQSGKDVGVYLLTGGSQSLLRYFLWPHLDSAQLSLSNGNAVVVGETQYTAGNQTLRNLTLGIVPILGLSAITATPPALDAGTPVTLSVTPEYAMGPVHYAWSGLPPGCASQDAPVIHCTPSTGGNYSVQATVTDGRGFSAKSSVLHLEVSPPLSIVSSRLSRSSVEAGNSMSMSTLVKGGVGIYSYTWTGLPPGCRSVDSPQLTCTPTIPGNYTVGVEVNDTSGEAASVVAGTLAVVPPLSLNGISASSDPVATGSTARFSAEISGGAAPFLYYWHVTPTTCQFTATATSSCNFGASGSYLVTLVVTDADGAIASSSLQVLVGSPTVTASSTPFWWYALLAGAAALLVANVIVWWWPRTPAPDNHP